jgi:hypothetical protein
MRKIYLLLSLPFLMAASPAAKFEPPEGRVLLLIGQDTKTILQYIKAVGVTPAGFMTYTSIQNMDGLDGESRDYGSGTMNAEQLVRKYPGTCLQIGLYEVDALKDVCAGKYDANISKLAKWLKRVNRPVFLRIGYEFDGPHNHYPPKDYVAAYKYLVDRLRSSGVKNAAYVWHSYSSSNRDLSPWYPGDDYVDWVGISYFNQPRSFMSRACSFAKEHGKPLMAAEATPRGSGVTHGQSSWNFWFRDFFKFVQANDIKAISYINSNWEEMSMWQGQGWGNARVQDDKTILSLWLEEIKKDKYLWKVPNE